MIDQSLAKKGQLMLLIQLAIVLLMLSTFTLSLKSLSIQNTSQLDTSTDPQPLKATKGDPGIVDYQKVQSIIEQKVHQEIATLPKPQNGQDGSSGVQGNPGIQGSNGSQGVQGSQGTSGNDGAPGASGQDAVGTPGREAEFQSNPLTGNLEWRYVGDDSWQLLIEKCAITNICL